ncbi:MAG TPA: hypothetical protein VGL07_05135 [Buttiauxella sp.]
MENIILVDEDNLPVIEECQLVPVGPGVEMGGGYAEGMFTARVRADQSDISRL